MRHKMNWTSRIIRLLLLISVLEVASITTIVAQDSGDESLERIDSDTRKEEIQRYFGYEDLFFRYSTLPYDSTMNTNEMAVFLDIGFLYFMFLPLLFIFFFLRKRYQQIIASILLLIYLFSCFYFSKLILKNGTAYFDPKSILDGSPFEGVGIINTLTYGIYTIAVPVFDTIYSILPKPATLNPLAYPMVFGAFFLVVFLSFRISKKRINRAFLIYICFGILFFLLSAGIVWYGFLLLPLSLMIISYFLEHKDEPTIPILRYGFYSLSGLFIIMSFFLRVSNISPTDTPDKKGKQMLFDFIQSYALGQSTEDETIDVIFPTLSKALKDINTNEALIYKVGTSINLHVNNNHDRIYADNQLSMYYSMYSRFGGNAQIFRILKEYGFGYIVIDLNTATIDRTPTKSLTRKYELLMKAVFNNPQLQLIASDRVIRVKDANGNTVNKFGLFGEQVYSGTFVIYKII